MNNKDNFIMASKTIDKILVKYEVELSELIKINDSLRMLTSISYTEGHKEGYDDGHKDGHKDGYDDGYDDGHEDGYDDGYVVGFSNCKIIKKIS